MNSLGGRIGNRQLAQHFVRQLQAPSLRNSATTATVSAAEPEIRIPLRKERNATDILHALEKTISRDPTAAHYKYHDDPFLIPMSNLAKRTHALSKESGRKAAMWILKEHANLFQHKHAEPEIPAFMPKAVYENKEQVSEELLMNVIREGAVNDSLTIYKLIEEDASTECKQALLELLCYHNNEEQLPDDLIEERWYRKVVSQQKILWKDSAIVEQLFDFLKKQDKTISTIAYNAMIAGTAKYMQVDRAWMLFEECETKNIPLNLTAYNWLIHLVPVLKDGAHERKALLIELLEKINEARLRPNVRTLNAALKVTASINNHNIAKDTARSLFAEFKKIGVEPCLATYYHGLTIFHNDRGPNSTFLRETMNKLEGKTFTMQDPNDTSFFVKAMDIAKNRLQDCKVADTIHKLLLTGENYNFIGENFKESVYYRFYMVLLLKNLPFEEFMQTYDLMVPHIYIPEPSVMDEIITTVAMVESTIGQKTLPLLFSQMVMFGHLDRQDLMTKTFNIMRTSCSPPRDSPIHRQYGEAAWTFWNHTREQNESRMTKISWTGKLLADVALLCLRGEEFDRFLTVLSCMAKEHAAITGTAEIEQLNEMFEACIARGHTPAALEVLLYCVEGGFEESVSMGKTIKATFPLTATQETQLTNLVGMEVLDTKSSTAEEH